MPSLVFRSSLFRRTQKFHGPRLSMGPVWNRLRRNNHHHATSWWGHVPMGPKDPILGVTEAFNADTSKVKLNLGVGAYRDDNNMPVVLESVKQASRRILDQNMNNEYAGIAGIKDFVVAAVELAYGKDSPARKNNSIAAVQALSGTGALRLGLDYIFRFTPPASNMRTVYVPDPTWTNHFNIIADAGLKSAKYTYYDPNTLGLNFNGLIADIKKAPRGSTFMFHACAHNPTGVDPKPAQWVEISKACSEMGHFILIDSAYQGFASGDTTTDAFSLRQFVKDGHQIALCQSFSKNFGLYGHRVGCLSFIGESQEEAQRIESQLKILARPMYSNPPIHGARIVSIILNDPNLAQQWRKDVKEMADRIITMRKLLKEKLKAVGSTKNWDHVTDQIGMFCYSGLTPEMVDRFTSEFHIYLTRNGRISMAGLTTKDIPYLAESIHAVTKGKK